MMTVEGFLGFSDWMTRRKENKAQKQAVNNFIKNSSVSFFDFVSAYDGDKAGMFSGFGLTRDPRFIDYQTIRIRSVQLLRENGYASAIIGRFLTKTINSGLHLRSQPPESILDKYVDSDYLSDWTTQAEYLWNIWSKDKRLVTETGQKTFKQLERQAFLTAMLSGDCLVIKTTDPKTGLPKFQLVDGMNVVDPLIYNADRDILHGVEFDSKGREITYFVEDSTFNVKPVKAYDRNGNRRAWLVKMSTTRIDERRGLPLLSVILQNLNELGKYMDSEQRAALVNSYVAMVHTKSEKAPLKPNPLKNSGENVTNPDTSSSLKYKQMQPGYLATNLAPGEEVKSFDTSRPNVNFAKFAENCIKTMAISLGIPPECLLLEFNSNYSASRAAIQEFADRVKEVTFVFTSDFNDTAYHAWLDGMILTGKIKAPAYILSLIDVNKFEILGAWRACSWRGLPKSNIDGLKMVKELQIAKSEGFLTGEDIADAYYDNNYSENLRQLKKEAIKLAEIDKIRTPQQFEETNTEEKEDE